MRGYGLHIFDMRLYPCLRLGHTAKGQSPWTQRGHVRSLAVGARESQTLRVRTPSPHTARPQVNLSRRGSPRPSWLRPRLVKTGAGRPRIGNRWRGRSAKLEADRSTEFPRGHPLLGGRADTISAFAFSCPPWQAVREQARLGGGTGYNFISLNESAPPTKWGEHVKQRVKTHVHFSNRSPGGAKWLKLSLSQQGTRNGKDLQPF